MAIQTSNYGLQKDAHADYYNIDTVNVNLDKIDAQMKLNAENPLKQDSKDNTVTFDEAETEDNIKPGEKHSVLFGKILKSIKTIKASLTDKVDSSRVKTDVPADAKFTDTIYTHPTTAGNKHIPAGGASGQILKWSAAGTAVWGEDKDTTYTHPSSHPPSILSNGALPLGVVAGVGTDYGTTRLRNIKAGTAVPTVSTIGLGEIYLRYS